MDKPPEGGGSLLTSLIIALSLQCAGAQMTQEYGCPSQEKILPCRCSTRGMEFQIWCSHSELPSVLKGLKAVGHYVTRPVDELILENNNLPSLPGNVFTSLRVLRLMLRNNRLERVSSSWLEGLNDSLLELFIVEPDLRSLPNDSLENLQALEAITLQSRSMKRLPRFTGLAKLRYAQINSPSLLELSPFNFRDLTSLEQLHVFGSPKLSRLEAGLLRSLPRLALLNISTSALSWIHPRAFIDLPELKEISLSDNEIYDASIVGRAIVDLPSLGVVNLDGNRVARISEANFVDNPSLKRLSIARNLITDIGAGAYQRLTNLRILDLSHNRLGHVSAEFFLTTTGSQLEDVWLVDNNLHSFNELRAILEALPGLKFLDASYNYLGEIPYGAIRGHPTLERLHLDHNRISFLEPDSFVAMPALRELRLRNNSLDNLLATPYWNLPGLKGLDLSENYYRHLDRRLLGNLPNLRRLDISGNGITVVEPDTFVNNMALEHLNISGNALAAIHPMTFRHLSRLYELDAGWNRLLEIVPGLPRSIEHLHLPMNRIVELPTYESRYLALPSLRSFDISGNGIERIKPGTLVELTNLRKFNIGYNALRIIEDRTFEGLTRLEKIDLRYNRLVSLHGRSLEPLRNLMDLNIRGNRIEVIRPDLFQANILLQRLDLSRNNIAQIAHSTFSKTRDLRELYASHNTLTELPVSLRGLNALEVLDLSFNKINILSPETLGSLTSLLELRLVRNRIKELREGAFERLPRLTFIDLENNDLRIIERNAIRSLPELRSLRLGKNRLRSIPSGAFTELPLLQSAELQENRIREIAKNAFVNVPHLLFLNLSNNQLPEIRNVGLESLRSLEVLDLSDNRLSRVTSDSLASMEWLVELKMDNNRICSVQGSPFDGMPRLRVLSLRSNRMTSVAEKAFKRLRSNIAILDIDGNPLSCSCGMLWLRGWLRQGSAEGPRCADGSLFKEIRLSRQDCEGARQMDSVNPGCENEAIDHSPSSVSSISYAPSSGEGLMGWANLRDPPKDHQTSQNLDYLIYEDYPSSQLVDSSENDKKPEASSTGLENSGTGEVTLPTGYNVQESSSTDVSMISSGNSMTKEKPQAGIKNNPVPPSPSSSGFTFFGVPLPSINFNLWGNSGSRKAQRKEDAGKTANSRPGRSRYRGFPPTEPEIHRGGFLPLPLGQSGFVPIPDPRFFHDDEIRTPRNESRETLKLVNSEINDTRASIKPNRTGTVTRIHEIPGRRKNEHKTTINREDKTRANAVTKLGLREREELTTSRNEPVAHAVNTNPRRIASNLTKIHSNRLKNKEKGEKSIPTTQSSVSSTGYSFLPTVVNAEQSSLPIEKVSSSTEGSSLSTELLETGRTAIDDRFTDKIAWTSPSSLEISELENLTDIGSTTRTKKISIYEIESRLPPGKHISAENVDNDDALDYRRSFGDPIYPEKSIAKSPPTEISEASALSALLIPGGQVSASSSARPPSGRSTIEKVASPHLSLKADRDFANNDNSSNSIIVNSTIDTVTKIGAPLDESTKIIDDNPFNWYFQNYNESYIEPYVAVVYSAGSKNNLPILTIFFAQLYLAVRA